MLSDIICCLIFMFFPVEGRKYFSCFTEEDIGAQRVKIICQNSLSLLSIRDSLLSIRDSRDSHLLTLNPVIFLIHILRKMNL